MALIDMASSNSTWRGLDYHKEKKVINYKQINDNEYSGVVLGSNNEKYNVLINLNHPRSSTCDCPFAKDKKIVCKHKVALYFTAFPSEVNKFLKEVEEANERYEKYEDELYEKTIKYINSMSKKEMQQTVVELLDDAPKWVYDRFVRDHVEF